MGAREDTKISRAMLSNISSRQRSMWIMFLRFKINPKIAIRYSTSARIMTIKFSLTNLCGQTKKPDYSHYPSELREPPMGR
jgi:hypothetical protein